MINFGGVPAGSVLPVYFSTYGGTNGESITLTGLAVTDVEIYKGTSATQRASDAGYALIDTDGIDVDGITGIHAFSIDTGDNTDSGFYSVGSFFTVVVSAVTVDAQTVNFIAATFRLMAAEHTAGYPVSTIKDGTGTGEIDTTSGGVLVAAIAANAITATAINADAITAAKIADGAIDAATFAANAITSTVIANDAITDAKVAADVTIASVTGSVGSVTGAVGSVTGAVGSIGTGGITATSFAANAITAAKLDPDVTTELQAGLATSSAVATLQTSVNDVPTNAELATALGTADDAVLAAIAALNNVSAAAVADAVWDEDATAHQTTGTFGQAIGDPVADTNTIFGAVVTGAAGATVAADIIAIKAETASILADTVEIGTAGAGLTAINLPNQTMDIIGNITGNLSGSVGSVTGAVGSVTGAVGSVAAGGITATSFAANAITAAKLDPDVTTELQAGLATQTSVDDLPTNAELATALGTADDAVLAQVALVKAVTDKIDDTLEDDAGTYRFTANALEQAPTGGSAPTAAAIADAVWDEDATGHQTQGSFGQAIGDPAADANTIYAAVVTGAAGATIAADIVDIEGKVDDLETRLGTPTDLGSGATVAANLVDIEGQTDDIGVAGAGLTAINLPDQTMNIIGNITGNLSGSVGSVTGAVGSVTGNVGGNVTGTIGGLTAAALKDFFDTDSATTYASAVAGSVVKEIADNAGGASLTADAIADEVQTRTIAAVTTVNGLANNSVTAAALAADAGTEIATAVWASGTRSITVLDEDTTTLDLDATIRSAVGLASANLDTQITDLPTNAELAAALGTGDDAVLAQVALIKAKTDSLTFTSAGKVDANMLAVSGSTVAADNLEAGAEGLVEMTCASGSTTTSIVTNLTELTDDHYNGRVITFITGAMAGQSTNITDYNGTTKTLTVTALTESAADGDEFVIS